MKFLGKIAKSFKTILLDLLIVFIGVFLAFQLSAYKELDNQRKSRLNYYRGFRAELMEVDKELTGIISELDRRINEFDSLYSSTEKPQIRYNPKLSFFFEKPYIVESAFNAGNFNNLNYKLLANISGGSNLFRKLSYKINEYNERVKDITYVKAYREELYYDGNTLKPEYHWYVDEMKELKKYAELLKSSIEKGALPAADILIEQNG